LTALVGANATPTAGSMAPASAIAAFLAGIGQDFDTRVASAVNLANDPIPQRLHDRENPVGPVGRAVNQAASDRPRPEASKSRFASTRALVGLATTIAIAGCGATDKTTATTAADTDRSSPPAWQHGTPPPKVTRALISQPGYGLTPGNANLGTVDEVFGAVAANVHVNPSGKALNDQYTRFGRCMGEYLKIHNLGQELALLVAYNRKDQGAQSAVEKASSVCAGSAAEPDTSYKQSLKANP
jgi:hypothetical protein